jgi:hypothetical protein
MTPCIIRACQLMMQGAQEGLPCPSAAFTHLDFQPAQLVARSVCINFCGRGPRLRPLQHLQPRSSLLASRLGCCQVSRQLLPLPAAGQQLRGTCHSSLHVGLGQGGGA